MNTACPPDWNPQAQDVLDNQTSSTTAQNTYAGDGKRYMLSMFDSGLALYGNKKLLDAAGVKYPTTWDTAWTVEQFDAALKALATKDKDGKVLDVKENYGLSGYSTYAFLPIISSAGHLVMEDGKADGALNSEPVVAAFTKVAGWKQYTDANADDKAFTAGRVGLSWVGHWVYNDYKKALGDDLVVIPLPNFGTGAKTGQGSLAWGISKGSKNGIVPLLAGSPESITVRAKRVSLAAAVIRDRKGDRKAGSLGLNVILLLRLHFLDGANHGR